MEKGLTVIESRAVCGFAEGMPQIRNASRFGFMQLQLFAVAVNDAGQGVLNPLREFEGGALILNKPHPNPYP